MVTIKKEIEQIKKQVDKNTRNIQSLKRGKKSKMQCFGIFATGFMIGIITTIVAILIIY